MTDKHATEKREIREKIRGAMAENLDVPVVKITDAVRLLDLVSESFVLIEMVIELQEAFKVRFNQEDLKDIHTAGALIDLVAARVR